jgi:hypothetical protein
VMQSRKEMLKISVSRRFTLLATVKASPSPA